MILDREEPGAKVWPKLMSTLQPKIAIFQRFSIFTCVTSISIPLFTLVTQLSKSVEKYLAYYGL